ncbi:MAG: hypothetical protein ABR981_02250 [Candidatus Micrarchaeaceae archaeon]|jgi:hypothetical protein
MQTTKPERTQIDKLISYDINKGKIVVDGKSYIAHSRYLHEINEGDILPRHALSFFNKDFQYGIKVELGIVTRRFIKDFQKEAEGLTGRERLASAVKFVKDHVSSPKTNPPVFETFGKYHDIKSLDYVLLEGDNCMGKSMALVELFRHDDLLTKEFGKVYWVAGYMRPREAKGIEPHAWAMLKLNEWYILEPSSGQLGPYRSVSHDSDPAYYSLEPTIALSKK